MGGNYRHFLTTEKKLVIENMGFHYIICLNFLNPLDIPIKLHMTFN